MAKNRAEPTQQVESESLSEEEESDDGSTDGSESDGEINANPANSGKKPEAEPSSSDEEEEGGSETESPSESDGPPPVAKPSPPKPAKSKPKKNEEEPATPKPTPLKRAPAADAKESAAKRPKQKEPESENSEKKQLFQRLWSEEDEIAMLKGMIDYAAKKKADPVADLSAFHDFIKKSIHVDVSRAQLQDKIRRLKKKFENNKGKEKDGKNRTFSKPHEQEAYDLSKRIWDGAGKSPVMANGGGTSAKKKPSKAVVAAVAADAAAEEGQAVKAADGPEAKNGNLPAVGGGGAVEERIARIGSEAFNAGEGASEWKKLEIREIELYSAQLDVKKAQADMVLHFLKSSS